MVQSLQYASRIQRSFISSKNEFEAMFPNGFVVFFPKDIVSGDFFWVAEKEGWRYCAVIDCTGHGPPGAMVSLVISSELRNILKYQDTIAPGEILDVLDQKVTAALQNDRNYMADGADMILIRSKIDAPKIEFAGAMLSVFAMQDGGMRQLRGCRKPIGEVRPNFQYQTRSVDINDLQSIYLFTDGYQDQFGMLNNKKLKRKALLALLEEIYTEPPANQQEMLADYFLNWKGSMEQTDDVTLVGIQFS